MSNRSSVIPPLTLFVTVVNANVLSPQINEINEEEAIPHYSDHLRKISFRKTFVRCYSIMKNISKLRLDFNEDITFLFVDHSKTC